MLSVTDKIEKHETFTQVGELLEDARKFFNRIGNAAIERKVVDMAIQMREPFYIIAAGEYNSGKSSFINALLGDNVVSVGPTPTTDKITLLTYGEEISSDGISDHLCRISYPLEALKEITLVDTPGTNSIMREQSHLIEDFVHRAELILFITSSDSPLSDSERMFLEFLRTKWGRKVLIILNKIDLKNDTELNEIITFIEKNCYKLLGFEPKILTVSALEACRAKTSGDIKLKQKSKIEEVEEFVFEKLDLAVKLEFKLSSPLRFLLGVFDELKQDLQEKVALYNTHIKSVERLEARIENKKREMREYILKYKGDIPLVFSRLKEKIDTFLSYNMTTRMLIATMFAREKIDERFKRDVFNIANPLSELDRIISDAVDYVTRNTRSLWEMAHDYIEAEISRERRLGSASEGHLSHHYEDRKEELTATLKEHSKEYRELDAIREGERIRSTAQSGLMNFLIIEGLAIASGIGFTSLFSWGGPNLTVSIFACIIAGIGFIIIPKKRRTFRRELFKRVDALPERFSDFLTSELCKVIDRVIENIGNSMASYRDHRWAEREEVIRRSNELNDLAERAKSLMRKASQRS
ncbi:MAG: dynamin family protein [Planctomycetes bacterium]|nr:dynamin family protein [Planctomycetota bacterium]